MTNRTPLSLLSQKITVIASETEKQAFFSTLQASAQTRPIRVAFVNAHAANLCHANAEFLKDILDCDYVLRDGSGMKMLYQMLGKDAGLNLNGTDLIPELLALYRGQPLALMGTSSPYLERAGDIIAAQSGQIAIAIDGFQSLETYRISAERAQAALIILAMGMPKQEAVAADMARHLNHPCLIVCGGAILDFIGGKVSRAPQFLRKLGMEWVYRLLNEPKRLFKRYVIGNAVFLGRGLIEAIQSKRRGNH